jgi:hypothetical protein
VHPGPGDVHAQGLEQVDLRRFCCSVGFGAGQPAVSGDGCDAGDDAVPAPQHAGQHSRDGVAHPGQVDPDVLVEHLGVPCGRVHLLPVAGGQHGHVDGSEFFAYSYGGGRGRRSVGDVEGHDEHVPSRHLPELLVAASRDRDGASAGCEFPGDRCADAA